MSRRATAQPEMARGARVRLRDLRMLPVVLITWAIVGSATAAEDGSLGIAAGAAVGCVVMLTFAGRARRPAVCTIVALGFAFGGAAAAHVAVAQPERAAFASLDLAGGRSAAIEVVVVGKVEPRPQGWAFDALARQIRVGATRISTPRVPVTVHVPQRAIGLDVGADARVVGTVVPARTGERAVSVIRAEGPPEVIRPPQGILATASGLRSGLQTAVAGLPEPAAGLIAGLAVGDTSAVEPLLDSQMKSSSLSHLTAVSGANCALVVGIAFAVAAVCGLRRSLRVGAGAGTLVLFVILVTPEPSVVRAAAMAAIAMVALLLGRSGVGVAVLCSAVALLLIIDPWLSLSLGFALSAAATGSLLLGAAPLAAGLSRWLPAPVATLLAVPLAAQLACGPLLILIDPVVPLYGIVANLVAGPAAPVATVLGLLVCVAAPFPVLAQGFAVLAWLPAAWIAETASVIAALPGNAMPWIEGLAGLVALGGIGAGVVILVTGVGRTRLRAAVGVALAGVVGVVIGLGPVNDVVERSRVPGEWAIAACDVGQGDALLVRSEGQVALIDTGPDPAALSSCLHDFGVTDIDLLVLTHFDTDHRGGLPGVSGRIGTLLHGPVDDTPEAARLIRGLMGTGTRPVQAHAGMSGALGGARWQVLWPRKGNAVYGGNDASIVMSFSGGSVPPALFLGDLSASPQAALTSLLTRRYDVIKVAHHGSADQSLGLYESARPALALVSVGENTYGHPRDDILGPLERMGALIARTDLSGALAISVRTDGRLQVWHQRGVAGPG